MGVLDEIYRLRRKALGLNEITVQLRELSNLVQGNAGHNSNSWRILAWKELKLLLDLRSMVDATIWKQGDWELESWRFLNEFIDCQNSKELMFIDVGAYFGLYSLKALNSGKFKTIHAFESDNFNYLQLQSNLLINNLNEKIRAYNIFLSSKCGKTKIESSANYAGNRGLAGSMSRNRKSIKSDVSTKTLDCLISARKKTIFMKVDTEGNELSILRGSRRLLSNNTVFLLLECNINDFEISKFLEKNGFRFISKVETDSNWIWTNSQDVERC